LSAASSDILLSVNGQKNHVYVATINSYVYRLLGYGTPMNKTITAQGTAIKIPDFIAVAPGSCSSNVSISTTAAPTKDVSIVPSPVQNISYQDSFKTVTNITITNSATTTFNVCATVDRTPGIIHVPITLDG
jgi:hypothetical protein